MPIIKSAKKRVKTAEKAAIRNTKTKRTVRDAVKAFQTAITGGNKKQASESLTAAQSAIDTAVKKHVLHPNQAARKKSRLAKKAKEANISPAKKTTAATAKKTPAKKAPIKKAAKPAAAKKAAPKKTAAKKTTK